MGRPRQTTDDEILDTAREMFLRDGAQVSTTAIASALGISQATLFQRFGTKEKLLLAALAPPSVPPFVALLDEGPSEAPLVDQIEAISLAMASFFAAIVPRLSVLRAANLTPEAMFATMETPPPLLAHRALAAWIKRTHKRGLARKTDANAIAALWLGALHTRPFIEHTMGRPLTPHSRAAFVHEVADLLARGLEPR